MGEKDEKDVKLEELAKKLTPEYLLKRYKVEVLRKIQEGGTGLASELERIARLEEKLFNANDPAEANAARKEIEGELQEALTGIPERLKVRRRYTMTPEALRARQLNAQKSTGPRTAEGKARSAANGAAGNWIHGAYSRSLIRRTMGLCTEKCDKYPCPAVEGDETKKGELCLDHEGLPAKIKILTEAARSGEVEQVKELNAALLAMFHEHLERMLLNVFEDGALVKEEMFTKDGALLGHKLKNHPHISLIIDGMAKLGVTFEDMRMTPKELQKSKDADKASQSLADAFAAAGDALARATRKDGDSGRD